MKKLDFVFVGPYRTGTTWLYEYFKKHPEVSVPLKVKETFFFDKKYHKGYEWYFSHFNEKTNHKLTGEIAPSYFRSTEAAKRLLKNNPEIKIFFTLREPVERLISHYKHNKLKGIIEKSDSIIDVYKKNRAFRYASQYSTFINKWKNIIPEKNIYILKFENFTKNNQKYVNNICNILEIKMREIPEELNKKIGFSISPKYNSLYKIGYKISILLKKLKLFFLFKILKKIFNNFSAGKSTKNNIPHKERKQLENLLKKEATFYQNC